MKTMAWLLALTLVIPFFSQGQNSSYLFSEPQRQSQFRVVSGRTVHKGIFSYAFLTREYNLVLGNQEIYAAKGLAKIDTAGKVLWTTSPANYVNRPQADSFNNFSHIFFSNDSNLYCSDMSLRLYKVEDKTGAVMWQSSAFAKYDMDGRLEDYKSNQLLYPIRGSGLPYVNILRINKKTGELLDSVHVPVSQKVSTNSKPLIFVQDTSIYLTNEDTLFKIQSFENPILLWKAPISALFSTIYPAEIKMFGNDIFVFTQKGFGRVSSFNSQTGAVNWRSTNTSGSNDGPLTSYFVGNYLYTLWGDPSNWPAITVSKIDITTGSRIWQFSQQWDPPTGTSWAGAAMMADMTMDSSNQIYLAGEATLLNDGTKRWGVMKINPQTGALIKKNLLAVADPIHSKFYNYSIRYVGGVLHAIGYDAAGLRKAWIDTGLLTATKMQPIFGSYQYLSRGEALKNFGENKRLLGRVEGKQVLLSVTDAYNNIIWTKAVGDSMFISPGYSSAFSSHFQPVIGLDKTNNIYVATTRKRFAYMRFPEAWMTPSAEDSLIVFKLDSLGNRVQRWAFMDTTNYKVVNFMCDSLNRMWIGYSRNQEVRLTMFSSALGSNYVASDNHPKPYKLMAPNFFHSYGGDTVILFREEAYQKKAGVLMQNLPTPTFSSTLPIPKLKWVNNTEALDRNTYFVLGRDSSDQDMVVRVEFKPVMYVSWIKKSGMDTISLKSNYHNGSLYVLSMKGDKYFIRKLRGIDGTVFWTKPISVPARSKLDLIDFRLSPSRNMMTVAGAITDSINSIEFSAVFAAQFDTSGNEIRRLVKQGYTAAQNAALTLNIGQDGQAVIAGQITDSTLGYAGFVMGLDTTSLAVNIPAPQIVQLPPGACTGPNPYKIKLANPPQAPALIGITIDGVAIPYNSSDSSFQYTLTTAGAHSVVISYLLGSQSNFNSFNVYATATPTSAPVATQSGTTLTAPPAGTSYQWFLNGTLIPNATLQNYVASQSGSYSYRYAVNGCQSPMSPPMSFIMTAVRQLEGGKKIVINPNPASDYIEIRGLEGFVTKIRVLDITGNEVILARSRSGSNSHILNVSKLASGTYFVELSDVAKNKWLGAVRVLIVR